MDIKDSYLHGTIGVVKSISVNEDKLTYTLADINQTTTTVTLPTATQTANGLLSSTDKIKLDTSTGINQSIPYIVGPTTDTTAGTWTGTYAGITDYTEGLTIIYVPNVAGASTTTLNINGIGSKVCYYTGVSKVTTHYPAGTPILFTYSGGGWKRADYYYDSLQLRVYRQTTGYDADYPILVSRTLASSIGTSGSNNSYSNVYSLIGDDSTKIPTINPLTGEIKAPKFTGTFNGTASSVTNSLILKINSGSTEGTNLYTYNGAANKTLDIKQGDNVTLTATEDTLTIAASDSKVTQSDYTGSDNLRILLSYYLKDDTKTAPVRKSSKLTFNPASGVLTTPKFRGTWLFDSDSRSVATIPSDYIFSFKFVGIKNPSVIGLTKTETGSWVSLFGWKGYGDNSGPHSWELASDNKERIWVRSGVGIQIDGSGNEDWKDWHKLAYTSDIPTKISQLTNDSGYVTGGPYLPLSGGIINGRLWINSVDNSSSAIGYKNSDGTIYGYIGFSGENSPKIWNSDGGGTYTILHAGNYNSYSPKLDGTGATGTWNIDINGSANSLNYETQLTTSEELDNFLSANKLRITTVTNLQTGTLVGNDGILLSMSWNYPSFGAQICIDDNNSAHGMAIRHRQASIWSDWKHFAYTSDIPTKVSQLTNDSGFLVSDDLTNYVTLNTNQTITGAKTFTGTLSVQSPTHKKVTQFYSIDENSNCRTIIKGGNFSHSLMLYDSFTSSGLNYATLKGGYIDDASLTLKSYTCDTVNNTATLKAMTVISTGASTFANQVTALKFITQNGTSSQFVKGDGSLDSSSYQTTISDLETIRSNAANGKIVYDWYTGITATDTDALVNKWGEIVDFLDSVAEGTDITDEFVTRKTDQTITGVKTFTQSIKLGVVGSNWLIGMSRASLMYDNYTAIDSSRYHPIIGVKTNAENVVTLGAYINEVGFYGYKAGRVENNHDWSFCFNSGTGAITHSGTITSTKFITTNGTSAQFVKGDGSLDNNSYVTSTSLGNYVTLDTDQTITGTKTFESNSSTTGVSLILKNKGWSSGMSTAIDFYNGVMYTVPNARIETKMVGAGDAGGILIFYTQTRHESTNPNPNGLTERFRIGDNGLTSVTGDFSISNNLTVSNDLTVSRYLKVSGRNITYNSTSAFCIVPATNSIYLQVGNTNLTNNVPLYITGYNGNVGNSLYLKYSNIYTRDGNYINIDSGNYTSYTPILNSSSKHATNTSVIYAPTTAGTSGQYLMSNGSGAPVWTSLPSLANPYEIKFKNTGGTVVSYNGSQAIDLTGGVYDSQISKYLNESIISYSPTLGDSKVKLLTESAKSGRYVGHFMTILQETLLEWNQPNDYVYKTQGGIGSLFKIGGGYANSAYSTWLASVHNATARIGVVRQLNSEWRTMNYLAWTSDIPTTLKNPYSIKFTNTTGTAITYDGSTSVDLSSGINYATKSSVANNGVFYIEGTGTTAGTWLGEHNEIKELYKGLTIAYKIPIAGASPTTLKINNLQAVTCCYNTGYLTTQYPVGSVILLVYDGTYFHVSDYNIMHQTDCYTATASSTSAKSAAATYYKLRTGNLFICTVYYDNTAAAALTLNVNGTGAKPIWINGIASSATNYTLPAGRYLVYYDGTNYYFYTNGGVKIPQVYGNASSASVLQTSRKIWGQSFDGSGNIEGDLTIIAGDTDKSIQFLSGSSSTHNWRIAYIGTGTGDTNYLSFESTKATTNTWEPALQLACTTLNATFAGTVTAPNFVQNSNGISDFTNGIVQIKTLNALTNETATTYAKGSAGQILRSNGTNVYWSDLSKLTSTAIKINQSYSLKNSSWEDTGYSISGLETGSYMIQVISTNMVASGIFSVQKSLTDTMGDEIPLHVYGSAGWRPYLRTYGTKLEISANHASAVSRTVTIKIVQII